MGLIGSSYFAEHPALPLTNAVAYLNFDMVGRLRENKLTLQGIGSSSLWRKLIEKRNVAAGFNLVLQDDPIPAYRYHLLLSKARAGAELFYRQSRGLPSANR